ncbi:MAG: carboxypeptidase-like regulatory domain-containing protein, partial [Bacteroidota bacterium]
MRIFSIFLFLVFHFSVFAQTRTISGIVTDESGEPLIGASVIWKGTTKGVVTDFEGAFEIEVADEKVTLMISYTGYSSREKVVQKSQNRITIKLESGVELDEVVVTGMSIKREKRSVASSHARAEKSISIRGRRSDAIAYTKDAKPKATYDMPSSSSTSSISGAVAFNDISAGTLTAGEIHDFSKWKLWEDIAADKLEQWQLHWKINPSERYTVQLT